MEEGPIKEYKPYLFHKKHKLNSIKNNCKVNCNNPKENIKETYNKYNIKINGEIIKPIEIKKERIFLDNKNLTVFLLKIKYESNIDIYYKLFEQCFITINNNNFYVGDIIESKGKNMVEFNLIQI